MFAETTKEILLEHPLETVNKKLNSIFPYKYYKIRRYNQYTYTYTIIDTFNQTFIMHITLIENTPNTTKIIFTADYPHAIMDLTRGGEQAINTILEELLNQLDKIPKTKSTKTEQSDIPTVTKENFINTTKKSHTLLIITGYILSTLTIILPITALINYDPENFLTFSIFMTGILCLSIEISLSIILQYYEDTKSKQHGKIQTIICGISLIILGLLIHPTLILAGILIPTITITYFHKREKLSK